MNFKLLQKRLTSNASTLYTYITNHRNTKHETKQLLLIISEIVQAKKGECIVYIAFALAIITCRGYQQTFMYKETNYVYVLTHGKQHSHTHSTQSRRNFNRKIILLPKKTIPICV